MGDILPINSGGGSSIGSVESTSAISGPGYSAKTATISLTLGGKRVFGVGARCGGSTSTYTTTRYVRYTYTDGTTEQVTISTDELDYYRENVESVYVYAYITPTSTSPNPILVATAFCCYEV